jgi:hypothetical protein
MTADVDDDDHLMLVWLCTQLPDLRADADRDGWTPRLDAAIAALRSGVPATQVCRRLGLAVDVVALRARLDDRIRGTGPATLGDLRLTPVIPGGDYTCPHGSCERRARPDRYGHEPVCVDGTPMLPYAGPAARS